MTWGAYEERLDPTKPMVFLAFETTGRNSRWDEIIEVAAIKHQQGYEPQVIATLIRPRGRLSGKTAALTGITEEELAAEGLDPQYALMKLLEFIGPLPVVTYHCDLDLKFLNAACEQHELSPTRAGYSCGARLARKVFPELSDYALARVTMFLRLENHQAHTVSTHGMLVAKMYTTHRALPEAKMIAQAYVMTSAILASRASSSGDEDDRP